MLRLGLDVTALMWIRPLMTSPHATALTGKGSRARWRGPEWPREATGWHGRRTAADEVRSGPATEHSDDEIEALYRSSDSAEAGRVLDGIFFPVRLREPEEPQAYVDRLEAAREHRRYRAGLACPEFPESPYASRGGRMASYQRVSLSINSRLRSGCWNSEASQSPCSPREGPSASIC